MTTLIEQILYSAAQALRSELDDEFNPADWSGGNFDDAFEMGVDEGEVVFARYLVEHYKLES